MSDDEMRSDDRVIKSYVWHRWQGGNDCYFVSTIERDSSSPEGARYNETLVWKYNWETAKRGDEILFQDFDIRKSLSKHFEVCQQIAAGNHVGAKQSQQLGCAAAQASH